MRGMRQSDCTCAVRAKSKCICKLFKQNASLIQSSAHTATLSSDYMRYSIIPRIQRLPAGRSSDATLQSSVATAD